MVYYVVRMHVVHRVSKRAYGTDKRINVVTVSKASYLAMEVLMQVDVAAYVFMVARELATTIN